MKKGWNFMGNKMYVFTITYNFDGDYVAKLCNTYAEAIQMLREYLQTEIRAIESECEYTPSVLEWRESDVYLVYAEGYTLDGCNNYASEDCAYYKVLEVDVA